MFKRLLPVLPVVDLDAEVRFYERLGFAATVTASGFTALQHGEVLFGVQASSHNAPADFAWQIEVADIDGVRETMLREGTGAPGPVATHQGGFRYLDATTPSGYRLRLECMA